MKLSNITHAGVPGRATATAAEARATRAALANMIQME